ncbi:RHS repeat-associated core domain-containing protein [Dyella psychrodurans]|nr:RHS repeat-associated core domain-containing protein [Dyella psychrodurans]
MKPSLLRALWVLTCLLLCGVVHADKVTYILTDPNGTVLAEADAQGNITKTFDYRPYGQQALGQPPNGPGYTGHVNDPDTDLVYMQARYYDPEAGRFLSVDPVGVQPGDVYGFNRYVYASNNPVMRTDPDGRQDYSAQYLAAYSGCANTAGCKPEDVPNQIAAAQAPAVRLMGFVPIASDVQNVTDAVSDPSPLNVAVATVGALPVIGGVASGVLKEAGEVAKAGKTASKIDRAAFKAERAAYWKAEAKANPAKYSEEDLARMQKGGAPTGPDGHPMELHHVDGTPEGGVSPMSRTDHRSGDNYKDNHPWLFNDKQ